MVLRGKRGFSRLSRYGSAAAASAAYGVGRGLYTRLAKRFKSGRSLFTRTSGGNDTAKAITQQHDSRQLYKRKRRSRKARMMSMRKYKSFLHKQLKAECMRQYLSNLAASGSSLANEQNASFIVSGALQMDAQEGVGDLKSLIGNQIGVSSSASIAASDFKYYLIGMNIDYTITNDSAGTIELDVYDFRTKKDRRLETVGMLTSYDEGFSDQQLISATIGNNTKIAYDTIGATPFMNPGFCKTFTVNGKRRFYISPGQTISWTDNVVFKKPYKLDPALTNQLAGDASHAFVLAGVTRGLLLIYKGVPSSTNACGDAATIRHCSQTNYRYKLVCSAGNQTEIGT